LQYISICNFFQFFQCILLERDFETFPAGRTGLTDKDVMFAVRSGDIDRAGILFERHNIRLFNFFYRLTYDRQTSEDLVQEVILRLIRFRETYKGNGEFTSWLYKIAYNVYIDNWRKPYIQKEYDCLPEECTFANTVDETVERNETSKLLERALMKLTNEEREILILSAYQKMKYREIAKIMDCSTGKIKQRAFRAIKKLKDIYLQLTNEAQR